MRFLGISETFQKITSRVSLKEKAPHYCEAFFFRCRNWVTFVSVSKGFVYDNWTIL